MIPILFISRGQEKSRRCQSECGQCASPDEVTGNSDLALHLLRCISENSHSEHRRFELGEDKIRKTEKE